MLQFNALNTRKQVPHYRQSFAKKNKQNEINYRQPNRISSNTQRVDTRVLSLIIITIKR